MSNQQYYGSAEQNPYQPPSGPPPGQQQQWSGAPDQAQGGPNPWQGQDGHAAHPAHPQGHQGRPPQRTDDEALLPQGQERSEQVETMQSYEMNRPQSEDDRAQEALQREFPNMDSSLIAAIWGDNKDMGAAREMLQHLSTT